MFVEWQDFLLRMYSEVQFLFGEGLEDRCEVAFNISNFISDSSHCIEYKGNQTPSSAISSHSPPAKDTNRKYWLFSA